MTLYFVASGMNMARFLGTQAYFFFVVNLVKVPFQYSLGLYSLPALKVSGLLLFPLILGVMAGRSLIRVLSPVVFTPLILALTAISALYLLL